MSTINHTKQPSGNTRTLIAQWENMTSGDVGDAIGFSQYTDKSVQVFGTFGANGALSLEGSNNGTDWAVLTDPQGNNLNITSPKIEMVIEATLYVRPVVTSGDGTTDLTVILLMKE